jgi:hypothetical protein
VGLIQRAVELRGIPTVSITVARDVTELLKLPRAVFVPWPMGHYFGVPFHRELQRRVLLAAFRTLETASEPGTIRDLIIKWADVRREAKTLSAQGWRL